MQEKCSQLLFKTFFKPVILLMKKLSNFYPELIRIIDNCLIKKCHVFLSSGQSISTPAIIRGTTTLLFLQEMSNLDVQYSTCVHNCLHSFSLLFCKIGFIYLVYIILFVTQLLQIIIRKVKSQCEQICTLCTVGAERVLYFYCMKKN